MKIVVNVIYVGRAQNIKFKVSKLFLKDSKRARKIHERVQYIFYELSGNELFNKLIHRIELEILKPKFNFIKSGSVMQPEDFAHHNFVLEHCGRNIEEKAIILVENNEVIDRIYKFIFSKVEIRCLKKCSYTH